MRFIYLSSSFYSDICKATYPFIIFFEKILKKPEKNEFFSYLKFSGLHFSYIFHKLNIFGIRQQLDLDYTYGISTRLSLGLNGALSGLSPYQVGKVTK